MKLTREGKRFSLATALLALAALNTGNNLIYLIFAMMFSILILSFAILRLNMLGILIRMNQGTPIFAKKNADIEITVINKKKVIPSYSLYIRFPRRIEGEVYCPRVSAQKESTITASVLFQRRGLYRKGDVYLESGFPFIFFSARKVVNIEGEVVVYPEMSTVYNNLPELHGSGFSPSRTRTGKGDEFATVREFREGDDWRRIHWKASAKTTKLMVMEHAAEESRQVTIILDNLMPCDTISFERSISYTASIVDQFLKRGFYVRLLTCRKLIPFGSGEEHLYKILDVLAVLQSQDSWECPLSEEPEGAVLLVLNSEDSPLKKFIPFSSSVIYAPTL
jgi:uncharacterized protein (DUF58 family)